MSFIHSGSETRISRIPSNNLDGWQFYMTAKLQINSKHSKQKRKSNVSSLRTSLRLLNISTSCTPELDIGVVHQFIETVIFIATPMKTHIQQFILPVNSFFVDLLTEKLRVQCQTILCLLAKQTIFLSFFLASYKNE